MLKSKRFWAYESCQSFELRQEILDNYKVKGKIFEDAIYLYDHIGVAPHPSLKLSAGREHGEITSLSFINNKVDINTMKIMFHLLPSTKIVSLKFSSNIFEIENLSYLIDTLLSKQNNVFCFIYEYNSQLTVNKAVHSIDEVVKSSINESVISAFKSQSQLMVKLFSNTKFEGICLRGNMIGDATAIEIFTKIATNNTSLKVLSLYHNNLTSKCIGALCTMLEKNKTIEEINLGKNFFKDEDIALLNKYMGKYLISNEQFDIHNKKLKERDMIIAKNIKLKIMKKQELEVPFIDEVIQLNDKHYVVKNNRIKVFNLIVNPLTEKCFDSIKYMLDYNEGLLLSMDYKLFNSEQKQELLSKEGKYFNRIYLSK